MEAIDAELLHNFLRAGPKGELMGAASVFEETSPLEHAKSKQPLKCEARNFWLLIQRRLQEGKNFVKKNEHLLRTCRQWQAALEKRIKQVKARHVITKQEFNELAEILGRLQGKPFAEISFDQLINEAADSRGLRQGTG